MLTPFDYLVIGGYFLGVLIFGLRHGGRQEGTDDYFLGSRSLPWWAVCFSVVATETSTLTVIGIPAVAYGGTLTFYQITFGYVLGRLLVSVTLLPRYFNGNLKTAYALIGERFGDGVRATASLTFMVTRLLADGVRLFATAIPIKLIAESAGFTVSYPAIILAIGVITMAYTMIGGIRAVVWMDVVQMIVYVGGGLAAFVVLLGEIPATWWADAAAAGKLTLFDVDPGRGLSDLLTRPYAFVTATVGGAVFSMASHGADQLIVQRLLACRSLADSRKALIGSGLAVMVQFALFLGLGLALWSHYGGASPESLGLSRADEIFPRFIIEGLPPGLSGLILAGIIAAAMSTLSSSLNALASSSMLDIYERIRGPETDDRRAVLVSRGFTLLWGFVFIAFATVFKDQNNPVVELGLAIASYTYGGLLGLFALGLIHKQVRAADAVAAFCLTLFAMLVFALWLRYDPQAGWYLLPGDAAGRTVAWPWIPLIGSLLTLGFGSLLALRYRVSDVGARGRPQ